MRSRFMAQMIAPSPRFEQCAEIIWLPFEPPPFINT
jgi:hypothetical protein